MKGEEPFSLPHPYYLLFVSVGTLSADVCFHLSRSASVSSGNILLLLSFGLYFGLLLLFLIALRTCFEGNPPLDYRINIVTSVIHVSEYSVLNIEEEE